MSTGLILTDCSSSSLAWLDPGCLIGNAGAVVGDTVTKALEPVWIILAVVVVLVVLIGTLPNIRHIVPVFL
jgi:hypothetical protein